MPIPSATATHSATGSPATSIEADATAASAATGPTDRSMPPEMITSVMPIATQALMLDCCRMLMRLRSVRNTLDRLANTTTMSSRPASVPMSRRLTRKRGRQAPPLVSAALIEPPRR